MVPLLALFAAGCSQTNEYRPAAGASAADVFREACFECHKPKQGDHYFELGADMASADAIADKVTGGGFTMPAFPHIQGETLQQLTQYVLSHSKTD